jgi:hypothetical protein
MLFLPVAIEHPLDMAIERPHKLATVCDPAMDTPTMPRSRGEPTHEQPSSLKIRFDASKAGTG